MSTFSLRTQITTLSVLVLVGVASLAFTGYSAMDRLLELTRLETVNATVRAAMELDMMHDAIHSDVVGTVTAIQNKNAKTIEDLKQSLNDHIATSDENIKTLGELDVSPDVKNQLSAVIPHFKAYQKKAEDFLELAADDVKNDTTAYIPASADFKKSFKALEEEMGTAGDSVITWSQQIKEEGVATAKHEKSMLLIVLSISLLLATCMPIFIVYNVFKPLNRIINVSDALANENYDVTLSDAKRGDEIGRLAKSLDALRIKAAAAFQLKNMVDDMPLNIITANAHDNFKITYTNKITKKTLATLQAHLSINASTIEDHSIDVFFDNPKPMRDLMNTPGNLPHSTKIMLGPETLDLKISAMFDKKGGYLGPMIAWSIVSHNVRLANEFEGSIGAVSNQVSASATTLQDRATSLQGAIEELSISALEISKRVNDSLSVVREAVETGASATAMTTQLSSSAENINNVVTLIRSIAEKTNLLALNATIESARAGDAGKGFAVVANEVKTLASQTANAIIDITKKISEMQQAASSTAAAINHMSEIVKQVNVISTTIAGTVEEQQAATSEIARNISGTSDGGTSSSTIMGLARDLNTVSGHLQSECDGFLAKVRAI